jgi:predicted transcriptional regulator
MSESTITIERGSDGKFTSSKPEEIIEAMPDNGEPVIASEMAAKVGLAKSTVNHHLNRLLDENKVNKKIYHAKRVVWFLPRDGEQGGNVIEADIGADK